MNKEERQIEVNHIIDEIVKESQNEMFLHPGNQSFMKDYQLAYNTELKDYGNYVSLYIAHHYITEFKLLEINEFNCNEIKQRIKSYIKVLTLSQSILESAKIDY